MTYTVFLSNGHYNKIVLEISDETYKGEELFLVERWAICV